MKLIRDEKDKVPLISLEAGKTFTVDGSAHLMRVVLGEGEYMVSKFPSDLFFVNLETGKIGTLKGDQLVTPTEIVATVK